MAAWYADDKGFRMGDEGRIILNDPERQKAVEKLDEVISTGVTMGDFSQNGHFAEVSRLNEIYDDNHMGITKTVDTKPDDLESQRDNVNAKMLEADREKIDKLSVKKD